jgi:hypothetical protein
MAVVAVDHGSDKNGADDGIWEWIMAGARRRAGDCRRTEAATAALPQMRAAAGCGEDAGCGRQNVRRGCLDAYTTNIISSRDMDRFYSNKT